MKFGIRDLQIMFLRICQYRENQRRECGTFTRGEGGWFMRLNRNVFLGNSKHSSSKESLCNVSVVFREVYTVKNKYKNK
jgi:hypothetical protein